MLYFFGWVAFLVCVLAAIPVATMLERRRNRPDPEAFVDEQIADDQIADEAVEGEPGLDEFGSEEAPAFEETFDAQPDEIVNSELER